MLRPGKAGSNTAADHVAVLDAALAQVPAALRARDDTAGWRCWFAPTPPARRKDSPRTCTGTGWSSPSGLSFAHLDIHPALAALPNQAWTPAYQARKPRAAETGCRSSPATGPGSPRPPA